jgi:radical SAM peptide maturase (CXXX-repeat target family)
MAKRLIQFQDIIARLYPELAIENNSINKNNDRILSRTITFQVTDNCNLACKYCYQTNKGKRKMSFETAKKFIDLLLTGEKGFKEYLNPDKSPALIIEFIGGEPFLEIDLIDQICDYFFDKMIEMDHKWLTMHTISICSNGVLYFDPKVQKFLNKHKHNLSFSITIDGNKELHDSCRVFPDGSPSYDIAIKAAQDWMNQGNYMGSKITIAPGNVDYLYDAIVHMIDMNYEYINANTVYEKGWNLDLARKYYYQLTKIADYLIDNNLYNDIYLSLFEEDFFKPKLETDNDNWCGGLGLMLSCDPDGNLYPCIRYMESSLGNQREPYCIGNVNDGIGMSKEELQRIECLNCITRRTQSTDKCFYCPIASGCSWCSAYNYQELGTPNGRVDYSCIMHKARALANAYYWSKIYEKEHDNTIYNLYLPDSESLQIVSKEELDFIKSSPNLKYIDLYKDYFLENK